MTQRVKILNLGISPKDFNALKKLAKKLNEWDCLQCGVDPLPGWENQCPFPSPYEITQAVEQKDDGTWEMSWRGKNAKGVYQVVRKPVPDRGAECIAEIREIMAKYLDLMFYHQPDGRGKSLYIASLSELKKAKINPQEIDRFYPTHSYVVT